MPLNIMKSSGSPYQSSAKIVDGNLILSLPDAINPVVWRMELGSVKSSALEVRQGGENGPHLLSLKTPKGDVHDIAPYAAREDAVRALMRVSAALQNAQGKISPAAASAAVAAGASPAPAQAENGGMKWLLALGGVLAVIFLFAYISGSAPRPPVTGAPMADTATTTGGVPNAESGVPQSADDLLGSMN